MAVTRTTFRDGDWLDLACERLGGRVLAANDDFFAAKENLIKDGEAVWDPDLYVDTGKWMDGWETRRRRQPGHDWCLLQLGLPGRIHEVVVDTAHFTGNFPERCSLEAIHAPGATTDALLEADDWCEILPQSPLQGDHKNRFAIADAHSRISWTHLRLRIYPDGGVARLRVLGEVVPTVADLHHAPGSSEGTEDSLNLASLVLGAQVEAVSDRFYSAAEKMLLPDPSRGMFDGWETRRRRGPGNDWVILRLAAEGVLERAEIDTHYFKGNAPGACSLEGLRVLSEKTSKGTSEETSEETVAEAPDFGDLTAADLPWQPLLERQPLEPHNAHVFALETDLPVTHVRLQIYPDGGVARLRLHGRLTSGGARSLALAELNALPPARAEERFLNCCGSRRWAQAMTEARPFPDLSALLQAAEGCADTLERGDWLEAFDAHPRIGEKKAARPQGGHTAGAWSEGEQSGTRNAEAETLERLAAGNREYEERFGHLYLVCATGKSADELLALLEDRLGHTPEEEFPIAVGEQRKITALRLEKLLTGLDLVATALNHRATIDASGKEGPDHGQATDGNH